MRLGADVWLPASTWVDPDYCFLITIGDHCGFGEECFILAHDAQMDEFLDAARVGRVVLHPSCHIGARTVILPGVEIGPRTIVGANSVVSRSLPPDTVCAGAPARVICSLETYLDKHRARIRSSPTFSYTDGTFTPEEQAEMIVSTRTQDVYVTGGRSAELKGAGDTPRTDSSNLVQPPD
jgi:maltose O-acetyltransferase